MSLIRPSPRPATLSFGRLGELLGLRGTEVARPIAPVSPVVEIADPTPLGEVIEALPDPVMVVGGIEPDDFAGRRILFANAAAREMFRLTAENTLLVSAVRNPEVLEVVDEALFKKRLGEAAYEAGGVQDRYWRAWAKPLSQTASGQRRALLIMRDETDSRRNERMRADFLANASHELRTPLASLAGFIDTLRGHAKDDPAARNRFLDIMARQAWRMARLIEDLMSLSRIELNEHIAPDGQVDLCLAVADVVDALSPQAKEADVELRPSTGERGSAVVVGDRDQIVQVIQNLVDNAIKYAGKGGRVDIQLDSGLSAEGAVALRKPAAARLSLLTPDHAEGLYAAVRVSDTGPGLPRQVLPRLTERFYRVEGQKSGERLGTGLGLAIVKHIMNRHRGGLAVESLEGEGADFLVFFPLAAAPVGVTKAS